MPPSCELEFRRHGCREFHQFVIEEGHARFQPPGHGHVVDALDRIVDQHDVGIEPERPVDRAVGAPGLRQRCFVTKSRLTSRVGDPIVRPFRWDLQRRAHESGRRTTLSIVGDDIVAESDERRIPVIAAEHLVGALSRLNDLDVFRRPRGSAGRSRYCRRRPSAPTSRLDGRRQVRLHLVGRRHENLVVIGAVGDWRSGRNRLKFVTLLAMGFLEADGVGGRDAFCPSSASSPTISGAIDAA